MICDNDLKPGVDFRWTTERTSYALDWGLICSDENKGANLKSFYFVGAFLGLLVGTVFFDRVGRKPIGLIGIMMASISCIAVSFVNSYDAMLPLRIASGFGAFIAVSAPDLIQVELTPSKLRNLGQLLSNCLWSLGSFIAVGVSYFVRKWEHIHLVLGCIMAATTVVFFIYPESPRFHLVKGREGEARATFRKISRIFNTEGISEATELVYEDYGKGLLGQIKDFKNYPLMLKHTVILMLNWLAIAFVSYGLLFSWGKLGADIYSAIAFSTLGSMVVKITGINYFVIRWFGRKKAVIFNFAGLAGVFLLAIPCYRVRLSDTWDLHHVVMLCATFFVSGCWGSVALLTKELSPTSHRGTIYCMCSATARIGAFPGPYSTLLYNEIDARLVLAMFAGITALTAFLSFFNSDSTHKPIPSIPEDLVRLHSNTGHGTVNEVEDELK